MGGGRGGGECAGMRIRHFPGGAGGRGSHRAWGLLGPLTQPLVGPQLASGFPLNLLTRPLFLHLPSPGPRCSLTAFCIPCSCCPAVAERIHCSTDRTCSWGKIGEGGGKSSSTQVLLPGKSHGRRSLVGCSPWGREELDTTSLSLFTFMHWRRKWQPTPVFLPGECWGWRSLVGCHLWGRTESDTTEAT